VATSAPLFLFVSTTPAVDFMIWRRRSGAGELITYPMVFNLMYSKSVCGNATSPAMPPLTALSLMASVVAEVKSSLTGPLVSGRYKR